MAQPFNCRGGDHRFSHRHGADLHCGPECAAQYAAEHQELEARLAREGFTQHKEAPNLWVKDDVHISIEQVMHEGLDSALAGHSATTANRSH